MQRNLCDEKRIDTKWKINFIRQLEPLSYRCFCCFLISCAARPPHRVGLPYMLERAGLDVQQGIVNLFSTFPFVALQIFLRKDAPCMSTHFLSSSPPPIHIASLFLILLIILEIIKITSIPKPRLNTWDWINWLAAIYHFLIAFVSKRWSIYLVSTTFIICK